MTVLRFVSVFMVFLSLVCRVGAAVEHPGFGCT
jgi:hypothetical protein